MITLSTIAADLLTWLTILWNYSSGRTWDEFLSDVVYVQGNMIILRGGHRIYINLPSPYADQRQSNMADNDRNAAPTDWESIEDKIILQATEISTNRVWSWWNSGKVDSVSGQWRYAAEGRAHPVFDMPRPEKKTPFDPARFRTGMTVPDYLLSTQKKRFQEWQKEFDEEMLEPFNEFDELQGDIDDFGPQYFDPHQDHNELVE